MRLVGNKYWVMELRSSEAALEMKPSLRVSGNGEVSFNMVATARLAPLKRYLLPTEKCNSLEYFCRIKHPFEMAFCMLIILSSGSLSYCSLTAKCIYFISLHSKLITVAYQLTTNLFS